MSNYEIVRNTEEINDVLDDCLDVVEGKTSRFPGMTYEDGVKYAIEWLTEKGRPHPLED